MSCRMFALPTGTVPVVLNADVPDRALTAAFQAAGVALAALYLTCPGPGDAPEYRAAVREAFGFAIKGVLIAAGRTPGPYRARAIAEGQVFLSPGPRLFLRDPTDGPPRALRAHGDGAGPGRQRRSPGEGRRGTRARPAGRARPLRARPDLVAARVLPASRGASRSYRAGCLRRAVADGTAPLLCRPNPTPGAGAPGRRMPGPGPAARQASPRLFPPQTSDSASADPGGCVPPAPRRTGRPSRRAPP